MYHNRVFHGTVPEIRPVEKNRKIVIRATVTFSIPDDHFPENETESYDNNRKHWSKS